VTQKIPPIGWNTSMNRFLSSRIHTSTSSSSSRLWRNVAQHKHTWEWTRSPYPPYYQAVAFCPRTNASLRSRRHIPRKIHVFHISFRYSNPSRPLKRINASPTACLPDSMLFVADIGVSPIPTIHIPPAFQTRSHSKRTEVLGISLYFRFSSFMISHKLIQLDNQREKLTHVS